MPSAIFLFASLTGIPHEAFAVVPVINTSSTVTIAAELVGLSSLSTLPAVSEAFLGLQENGSIIAGQSEISHPSPSNQIPNAVSPALLPAPLPQPAKALPTGHHHPFPTSTSYFPLTRATTPSFPEPPVLGAEEDDDARPMDDSPDPNKWSPTRSEPRQRDKSRNIEFSKDSEESPPLEARISRIFYLNAFGHEIFPRPNGVFLESLQNSTSYAMSLRLGLAGSVTDATGFALTQTRVRTRFPLHLDPPVPRAAVCRYPHRDVKDAQTQDPLAQHDSRPRDAELQLVGFRQGDQLGLQPSVRRIRRLQALL